MIYLDNNATAGIRPEVKDAMMEWMGAPCNPSSVHAFGRAAKGAMDEARMEIAESVGADIRTNQYAITFTSSGSEANNLIVSNYSGSGSVVIASEIEHPSILKATSNCRNYHLLPVDELGRANIQELEKLLDKYYNSDLNILVSVMHANNETGVIQPIEDIAEICHSYGALVHSDCVQTLGKINLDISSSGIDFATLSSHKVGGPVGAGALVRKTGYDISPVILGGGQEKGIRAGTENLASIVGFAGACKLAVADIGQKYEATKQLRDYLEEEIQKISTEAKIFGMKASRLPNTSLFTMPGVESNVQLMNFDLEGYAISSGSACSSGKVETSHVLTAMGASKKEADSSIRVSLSMGQEKSDIEAFIRCWKKIFNRLRKDNNYKQVAN
jgi:cysteine desulfurase